MTISRTRFYKWINAFCSYRYQIPPEEGRDSSGKWLIIKTKNEQDNQTQVPF